MENELNFAKKISFKPLLTCIFFGVMVGVIIYSTFTIKLSIGIIFGVLGFLVESLIIYPFYLSKLYGYWRMDSSGIYYYDYKNWRQKMLTIFLPIFKKQSKLEFSDIVACSLVGDGKILNTQSISGGDLKNPMVRQAYYLIINTRNQGEIQLNLNWKTADKAASAEDIKQAVTFIDARI